MAISNLIIVESPTKAKTLSRFLGDKYRIEASNGHIRDLPKSELGVDIEHDFIPRYVIPTAKKKKVTELKKIMAQAKRIILASDPDREGEAIAWHIAQLMDNGKLTIENGKKRVERIVFHEITPEAVKEALSNPRNIDIKMVNAQQARRVLDRLVGYKLSPILWQKVKKGLSAGRVQSVALRLIVEREQEVRAFKSREYWSIEAELTGNRSSTPRSLRLEEQQATGNSFLTNLIELNGKKVVIKNKTEADEHVKNLEKADYKVSKITKKEVKKYSLPPFTTSTLQQQAANRLGYSAKKTMQLAQGLYEEGLITYMRTDSVNLAQTAINQTRKYIAEKLGDKYLPKIAKLYRVKSKVAQEAHEAIRPTNIYMEGDLGGGFTRDHERLYDLIWKRMVACQVNEAVMDQTSIDVIARSPDLIGKTKQSVGEIASRPSVARNDGYLFRASGSVVKFDGWLKLYGQVTGLRLRDRSDSRSDSGPHFAEVFDPEDSDRRASRGGQATGDSEQGLPELIEGEQLNLLNLLPGQHFTEPPARYTEASLIKALEEKGIGRPSTYVPIISTIQERQYVEKIDKKFVPTLLGEAVNEFLMKNFSNIIDYSFTADMENGLDDIAKGEREWVPMIAEFWTPFAKQLTEVSEEAERVKVEVETTEEKCPQCGKNLVVRRGKFGKFLACSGFPECKFTKSFSAETNIKCLQCGGDVVIKRTRHGKTFYGCSRYPECKFASWTKPAEVNVEQNKVDSG